MENIKLEHCRVDYIKVSGIVGAHLDWCIKEIVKLSAELELDVVLVFNDREIRIKYNDLIGLIEET